MECVRSICLASFILVAGAPRDSAAQVLKPGVKAPPIQVSEWIKGTPIAFEKGKLYVVEFWATWCGPCIAAMPTLSSLAQKHKGKVEVIGIDVRETGEDVPRKVRKFVEEMGDKMNYSVALDDSSETMFKSWLMQTWGPAIPATFLIDDSGTILWIGHPNHVQSKIDQVLAGSFNIEHSKSEFAEKYASIRAMYDASDVVARARQLVTERKAKEAITFLRQALKSLAGQPGATSLVFNELMLVRSKVDPNAVLAEIKKVNDKEPVVAVQASLYIVQQNIKGDRSFAKKVLDMLLSLKSGGGDPWIIYLIGTNYAQLDYKKDARACFDAALFKLETSQEMDEESKRNLKKEIELAIAGLKGR